MAFLLHGANVLYLVSYLVKDILWLRIVTVVAGLVLLSYNLLLPMPVLAAVAWSVVFTGINLVQIKVLLLERRPVRLGPDELRLYKLAFRSLTPQEFAKLLRVGRWESGAVGERIVRRGEGLDRLRVLASGRLLVEQDGKAVAELRPGCFVGEMSFMTGETPNADVVAIEASRTVSWDQAELKKLLAANAELRAAVQKVIGEDLIAKLRPASDAA